MTKKTPSRRQRLLRLKHSKLPSKLSLQSPASPAEEASRLPRSLGGPPRLPVPPKALQQVRCSPQLSVSLRVAAYGFLVPCCRVRLYGYCNTWLLLIMGGQGKRLFADISRCAEVEAREDPNAGAAAVSQEQHKTPEADGVESGREQDSQKGPNLAASEDERLPTPEQEQLTGPSALHTGQI